MYPVLYAVIVLTSRLGQQTRVLLIQVPYVPAVVCCHFASSGEGDTIIGLLPLKKNSYSKKNTRINQDKFFFKCNKRVIKISSLWLEIWESCFGALLRDFIGS